MSLVRESRFFTRWFPARDAYRWQDTTTLLAEVVSVLSKTLERVRALVLRGEVRVSLHGYEQLAADTIRVRDAVDGLAAAVVVEDYPEYPKGPCVLVLERDRDGEPIHLVWGIPARQDSPAVLITGYRPDPEKWDETWQGRRK